MPFEYNGPTGSGGVQAVTAGDTSIVVAGTASHPTVETADLSTIAADHATAADVAMNAHKITGLANGAAATDAAAFGQIPAALPPSGAAGGDLTGSYPSPTLAAIGAAAGPVGNATTVPVVGIDAKGRVTSLSGTTISGVAPGGSAGGDLTGSYPNPTLAAAGGGAAGPIGDATHVAAVTVDAKGRVTALSSVAISGASPGGSAGGNLAGTYPNPTVADVALLTTKGDLLVRPTAAPATRLGVGTNGNVLTADSTAAPGVSWQAPNIGSFQGNGNSHQVPKGSGSWRNMPDVQTFAAGAGQTWTMPADVQTVEIVCIGAGGGGGGGSNANALTAQSGGAGGGGGAVTRATMRAADISSPVTVNVGTGGTGGTGSSTVNGGNGTAGGDGGAANFGTYLTAGGGGGGGKGISASVASGAGGSIASAVGATGGTPVGGTTPISIQSANSVSGNTNGNSSEYGGASGGASAAGAVAGRAGGSSIYGGAGGAGGGAVSSTSTGGGTNGAGGAAQSYVAGGGGGGGTNGATPTDGAGGTFVGPYCGGGGGGGGAGNSGVVGKKGGLGSTGSGGGGGGSSVSGTGGNGGNGGDGRVIVISW